MAGAHPKVLETIVRNNLVQTPGYGYDEFCESARELIRKVCGNPEADVHFLPGGTQTNASVLDALLGRAQGVIAVDSGHINVHEAGAIELSGHKVITLEGEDGKLKAANLEAYLADFYADDTWKHMSVPGAVYISFPTEFGTLYSLEELEALSAVCRRFNLPLFVDGARLGYGLAASTDVTLQDIARLTDVFYIGGTKMGLLFGEAVVARNKEILGNFFTLMKARGAVAAKGRLLGMQFQTLFTDDLYMEIGRHGVALAMRLKEGLQKAGFKTFVDSPTNQQFFVLPNTVIDSLQGRASFELWGPRGQVESKVRFVTSWETTQDDVDAFLSMLK